MGSPTLVLASNSPRRRELLAVCGWEFIVRPVDVDEQSFSGEEPASYVLRLAARKADVCADRVHPDQVILAADTTVAIDGLILGKPGDAAEATAMLSRLRAREHQVHTGIAVHSNGTIRTALCTTNVPMRAYTDKQVRDYVASGDPLDKAGAYAIQHPGFHPVDELRGCYASVMGMPLCHLTRTLSQSGVQPPADVPLRCQAYLHYSCPVSAAILRGEAAG